MCLSVWVLVRAHTSIGRDLTVTVAFPKAKARQRTKQEIFLSSNYNSKDNSVDGIRAPLCACVTCLCESVVKRSTLISTSSLCLWAPTQTYAWSSALQQAECVSHSVLTKIIIYSITLRFTFIFEQNLRSPDFYVQKMLISLAFFKLSTSVLDNQYASFTISSSFERSLFLSLADHLFKYRKNHTKVLSHNLNSLQAVNPKAKNNKHQCFADFEYDRTNLAAVYREWNM